MPRMLGTYDAADGGLRQSAAHSKKSGSTRSSQVALQLGPLLGRRSRAAAGAQHATKKKVRSRSGDSAAACSRACSSRRVRCRRRETVADGALLVPHCAASMITLLRRPADPPARDPSVPHPQRGLALAARHAGTASLLAPPLAPSAASLAPQPPPPASWPSARRPCSHAGLLAPAPAPSGSAACASPPPRPPATSPSIDARRPSVRTASPSFRRPSFRPSESRSSSRRNTFCSSRRIASVGPWRRRLRSPRTAACRRTAARDAHSHEESACKGLYGEQGREAQRRDEAAEPTAAPAR